METIKFGVHNSTLTTTYAYKFMNLGYEIEDSSWQHDLTDSLIVNDKVHIHIPNAKDYNSQKGHYNQFVVAPYDSKIGDTDNSQGKVLNTFKEVINYLKQRTMQGLEKYGSWYYLLSDGVLVQKPMAQGDTLNDAPLYDANDDELVVVCSTAFNDEERKEFDNDMKQLFGDSYNGLSAQSVG